MRRTASVVLLFFCPALLSGRGSPWHTHPMTTLLHLLTKNKEAHEVHRISPLRVLRPHRTYPVALESLSEDEIESIAAGLGEGTLQCRQGSDLLDADTFRSLAGASPREEAEEDTGGDDSSSGGDSGEGDSRGGEDTPPPPDAEGGDGSDKDSNDEESTDDQDGGEASDKEPSDDETSPEVPANLSSMTKAELISFIQDDMGCELPEKTSNKELRAFIEESLS